MRSKHELTILEDLVRLHVHLHWHDAEWVEESIDAALKPECGFGVTPELGIAVGAEVRERWCANARRESDLIGPCSSPAELRLREEERALVVARQALCAAASSAMSAW
jgi:hypothetical protein